MGHSIAGLILRRINACFRCERYGGGSRLSVLRHIRLCKRIAALAVIRDF